MKQNDVMYLRISKIENADVYVSKGKSYKWISHLDAIATDGMQFDTRMGFQFYVVGVANNIFKGTFRL
jgi:hypothetical protein